MSDPKKLSEGNHADHGWCETVDAETGIKWIDEWTPYPAPVHPRESGDPEVVIIKASATEKSEHCIDPEKEKRAQEHMDRIFPPTLEQLKRRTNLAEDYELEAQDFDPTPRFFTGVICAIILTAGFILAAIAILKTATWIIGSVG